MRRRKFLHLAAATAALPAIPRIARAQAYPSRPIRLILRFAAGGSADIVARLIAQFVSDRIGQPVIVENRTGASSNLAGEAVARAVADGYTLLYVTTVNAINATFFDNLKFDLKRDFALVRHVKPAASRADSSELYVLATGYRGTPARALAPDEV